jgi:AbrB family looped-hinge helix DNA binding protein
MLRRITTVSTKGQLVIPSEMRISLGIEPGTRIAVTQDGSRIVLETVSEELVDKTRGLFSGKASLSYELKRQRHQKVRW